MSTTMPLLKSKVKLANGQLIPRIQLGVYMMTSNEASSSVLAALQQGYLGIDSAQMYHNERSSGRAIAQFLGADPTSSREDIFYTTKLASNSTSYEEARRSIGESVEACGLGYVDLFLLHSPYGGREARVTSWRAVEDAIEEGEVKMGGVSNFGVSHIEELMASQPRIKPVINQIEVHPFNTQTEIRKVCEKHGIAIEAYAPLARGRRMKHPKIVELAGHYGCTPAQLFVRWSIQHDLITLPKSVRPERMKENADVDWFEISEEHMKTLDGLDERLVTDWDPTECP